MRIRWRILSQLSHAISCRQLVLAIVVGALLWASFGLLSEWKIICMDSEVLKVVDRLCASYERGEALGTLCPDLCTRHTLVASGCQTHHFGKAVVFQATFRGVPVYVKSHRLAVDGSSEENLFWRDETGTEQGPTVPEFKQILKSHLFHNYNITFEEGMLYKLWRQPLTRESFTKQQNMMLEKLSLKTLWNLLQDSEYVFLSLFEQYGTFPELYGTCGELYVVEELLPLDIPHLLERSTFASWAKRAELSLSILELLQQLEVMLEYPVHLCDIKPDHFGLSEEGRVKYLDLDSVYLKPLADRSMGEVTSCRQHVDCDIFDCRGQCDLVRGKCAPGTVNNNLQVVCEKVFLGVSLGFRSLGGTGLLASRHAEAAGLLPILEACANPSRAKDDTRTRASEEIARQLRKSLQEVVNMARRLHEDDMR